MTRKSSKSAMRFSRSARIFRHLLPLMLLLQVEISVSSSPNPGMILRVRMADGSMQRLQIQEGKEDTTSLQEALSALADDTDNFSIRLGTTTVKDTSQTISQLGLKQGALITLVTEGMENIKVKKSKDSYFSKSSSNKDRWDPFPDLAKDYSSAVLKTKTRRASSSGMSYGDMANLQSSMHLVEPQPEGPLKRVYMCSISAQRFQANCYKKAKNEFECRVALLLGTIQKERVDLKRPKARTSLSSQTEASQTCQVAKIHAIWEPTTQIPGKTKYDAASLTSTFAEQKKNPDMARILQIAEWLGLKPVGWIFAYNDNRHKDEEALPVYSNDVKSGALLQIANMKSKGRIDGSRFATLSMDATSGATEAFQLSDVSVQMVSEDLWLEPKKEGRFVATNHNIIVDGKETNELDSVLCLVNTAMLSHEGSFSGPTSNTVKGKTGVMTNKAKKAIISALDKNDDCQLLETLCDFNLLLALDKIMPADEMEQVCALVKKWARGQKRGTELGEKLKLLLRTMLQ